MLRIILALIALAVALPAQATFSGFALEPTNPVQDQPFGFVITDGGCDFIQADDTYASDYFRTVAISGNQVDVTVQGSHAFLSEYCINPISTIHFSVGPIAQGTYNFRLFLHDLQNNPPPDQLIASATFTVSAPPPIPTLDPGALTLLAFGLALVASAALTKNIPLGIPK